MQINFELYIDSDDVEFKLELVVLMINNLEELKNTSARAWEHHDVNLYNACTHKTKSTAILLDDSEFNQAIEDVRVQLSGEANARNSTALAALHELCGSITSSLEHEAASLKLQS